MPMGKVLRVVLRRLINAVVTIFGIICLNYVLIRLMPGDPNLALVPRNTQFVGLAKANAELFGLDKPPFDQFVIYLQNTVTLNWGYSYFWHAPVA
ncbi:MAG: ABC transporter permease, partial [Methanobacteriota archaeon]